MSALAALLTTLTLTAPPTEIVVQGRLTGDAGGAVDGNYPMTITLNSAETGGTELYEKTIGTVEVLGGTFNIVLDGVNAELLTANAALWVGISVAGEPELEPRAKLRSTPMSLLAQRALEVSCTGCIDSGQLSPSLMETITSGAGASDLIAAHTANEAAHHSRYTNDEAIAAVLDSGIIESAGAITADLLPGDGLDEVSGGLISTTFLDVFPAPDTPKAIKDNNPEGITSSIDVPDVGLAETLAVNIKLSSSSNVAELDITMTDPNGTLYVLHQKTNDGATGLDLTFKDAADFVVGDLSPFIGESIAGTWTLKIVDSAFDTNNEDGTLDSWEIQVTTVSNNKLHITGTLWGDGHQIKDIAAPTDPSDAANKAYVDASFKDRVFTKVVSQLEPGTETILTHGAGTHLVFAQAWFKDPGSGLWSRSGGGGAIGTLGSGSDGVFKPTTNTTIAAKSYEYQKFEIPAGVTVTVTGGEPLIVKSVQPILIAGTLDLAGKNGHTITSSENGPGGAGGGGGGSKGGDGAYGSQGQPGQGPGGGAGGGNSSAGGGGGGAGHAKAGSKGFGGGSCGIGPHGAGGIAYDSLDADVLKGGSGGGAGGYGGAANAGGGGGGGGGGALKLIAPVILVSGVVTVNGGKGGDQLNGRDGGGGGGGSGGVIWLVSGSVDLTGGTVTSLGGIGGAPNVQDGCWPGTGGTGAVGRIRIDASGVKGSTNPEYAAGGPGALDASPLRVFQPDENSVAARNLSFLPLDVELLVIVP